LYRSIFAIRTVERLYLLRHPQTSKTLEGYQDFLMRVAVQCGYREDVETVIQIYETLSKQKYTHASPTNFNACGKEGNEALASCFLLSMDDSIDDIFHQIGNMATISKKGGGIGFDITRVRCDGSKIASTNGFSSGILPMLRHVNTAAQYVNQSGRLTFIFVCFSFDFVN
jgi:ribonucleotide reductase alpha subunit